MCLYENRLVSPDQERFRGSCPIRSAREFPQALERRKKATYALLYVLPNPFLRLVWLAGPCGKDYSPARDNLQKSQCSVERDQKFPILCGHPPLFCPAIFSLPHLEPRLFTFTSPYTPHT